MEPFGLFQFLQSLLKNPPAQDAQEEEKTQNNTSNVPSSPDPVSTVSEKPVNDSYLQFITNHEKRAQGVRKK